MVYLEQWLHNRLWQCATLSAVAVAAFAIVDARPSAQTTEPRVIEVTARRFAFEPAEIQAAVGERLQLVVRSADGVHGVEIKKFKVKKEIPRGGTTVAIDFTAAEAGRFPILCSEYCGDGHEQMKGMLVVSARGDEQSGDDDTPATKP
jgi:cytochrome c oxidase subunit 2